MLNWGRRSGKTTEFAYEALGTSLSIDNAQTTYYAQTFGDARDIAWDIFLDVFGEAVTRKNETLLEITLRNTLGGTSTVSLRGWESVYQAGKGRGTENHLILADEVAFCRDFLTYWDTVLDPTLLTTRGRAVLGSTPDGFNHFYDLTQRAITTDGWWYSHATSYDNPANDPADIDRKRKEIGDDRFSQEYLADFRKKEGLVYKEFDRTKHVYTEIPAGTTIAETILGIDFGFVHPAAVLTIHIDRADNYWVAQEFYQTGRTDIEIAEYAAAIRSHRVFADPESPSAIEELKRKNLNIRPVVKGKDSEKHGIDKVRELLKAGKLHIHASCRNLILEFETHGYKDDSDKPEETGEDALDALRYPVMMTFADQHTTIDETIYDDKPTYSLIGI